MKKAKANQLRIIAGQWRGRKLSFADGEGLRPTMDRVRETLFNWLQNEIAGARCLDLFSGSGALGLEALSRYAGEVVMIDKNPQAVRMIRTNLELLSADNAQILQMDARSYLDSLYALSQAAKGSSLQAAKGSTPPQLFDIVFLDPPFNKQLVEPLCQLLDKADCLSDQAGIYIEIEKQTTLAGLPKGWEVVKSKTTGQLAYYLVRVNK